MCGSRPGSERVLTSVYYKVPMILVDRFAHSNPTRLSPLCLTIQPGLANSKALDIDVGAGGKLVLASKAKKALNKPSKLAHKTLLNKAPRCVPACLQPCRARLCVCYSFKKGG